MKIRGIIIAAAMLASADADPRRLRKEGMRRLQPGPPPAETSQGEYIDVGVPPTEPAVMAKTEKSMSMATRDLDPKAGKSMSMSPFADSGSVRTVPKSGKPPGGSMNPLAAEVGSMRAKTEKTLADPGSMRIVDAKAEKQEPGSMPDPPAPKAEKTIVGVSMGPGDTKARKHAPGGSMSVPVQKESAYKVFSKASL